MRLTKRQLKRIIREEYSRLQRQGLIREDSRGRLDLERSRRSTIQNIHHGESVSDFDVGTGRISRDRADELDASMEEYVDTHIDDFIDLYIMSSESEYETTHSFWDSWEEHCIENGIPCSADQLEALAIRAEEMGEIEEGELFIGPDGGSW